MGGAGKTAVAERFLRRLPGGLPADPRVDKDASLPTPHSTFVFSFYDAPHPEAFFEALQMWLEHTPRVQTVLSVSQMLFLLQQTPGLIVLDGLERVQHDGQRGDFGRLASPALRDFLNHLAAGNLQQLSVLVTSRFPLADLRDRHPRFFRTIAVDQIEVHAAVELLRQRGVRGTDPQLAPIVHQCGRHALTVDFAGGYIAEYGQGDPATPLDLGTAEELQAAAEEELDEDRQEVLRQGYRFARIAEHYRDAMLAKDEAAMALLERICLFRLGVDAETIAAIFTGDQAVEVSGQTLAALNAQQLQSKLDWLVRMRIVEADTSTTRERVNPGASEDVHSLARRACMYSIHPAVRDGFLSGIRRDAALVGHEAVRKGLEVSLGEAPGENPSDPATLDLLEEIVHHTLQSGHVREAWDIYWNRIGEYRNLGWRLGAYERGERICRAFAGGQSPDAMAQFSNQPDGDSPRFSSGVEVQESDASAFRLIPFTELPEAKQALFINEWALYLQYLGRLAAAARCFELHNKMRMRQEDWENASIGNQNLCDVWLLSGRLQKDEGGRMKDELAESLDPSSCRHPPSEASSAGALATADEALRLAELADDEAMRMKSHAYRGHAQALRGNASSALADFRAALDLQHKIEPNAPNRPLYGARGLSHLLLLSRIGCANGCYAQTKAMDAALREIVAMDHLWVAPCNLIMAELRLASGDLLLAADLWTQARDWALARDAKAVLCWSYLVEAQHALANAAGIGTEGREDRKEKDTFADFAAFCSKALKFGLKIARDCGYGLYHIDLLLARARLHLLRGDAEAALDDIHCALGDSSGGGGIPADEETGQVELLAANHPQCGYAWAIPAGLQLRAEALLLRAAQQLGRGTLTSEPTALAAGAVPNIAEMHAPDASAFGSLDAPDVVNNAKQLLHEALDRWHDLRDPEPTEDNNFVHPETGKEYNYKAAETYDLLVQLQRGILTRYRVGQAVPDIDEAAGQTTSPSTKDTATFDVFLSHNSNDKPSVRKLKQRIVADYKLSVWLDEDELRPGIPWQQLLEEGINHSSSVAVLIGEDGLGPWESEEMQAALRLAVTNKRPVIPVLLPNAHAKPVLPMFLGNRTWVDLRSGLKKEGIDRLVWGITGVKH